jgi:hypothetical protein
MTVVGIIVVAAVVAAVAKLVVWPYDGGESHLGFVSAITGLPNVACQTWLTDRDERVVAGRQRSIRSR